MTTVREQASPLRRADGSPVRVLVVDDEATLSELLSMALRYEGWEVRSAADGSSAVRAAREFRPDAVVLDVMLPDFDGLEVLRRMRAETPDVPVLFLTARDAVEDRIAGLTAGGDDYVTKPFSLEELVARLRGLLRRAGMAAARQGSELVVGDLVLDEDSREVRRSDELVELTATEFELLRYLMRNPRRVLSKTQILDGVGFGGQAGLTRLFNGEIGGQVSWLLPAALALLLVGLWLTWRCPRTDLGRASLLLWGGWTVTTALVFSLAAGVFHSYYTIALVPGIAGLVGVGGHLLWQHRTTGPGRVTLAVLLAGSAAWAWLLLGRTPDFLPWLRWVIVVAAALATLAALVPRSGRRATTALADRRRDHRPGRPGRLRRPDRGHPAHRQPPGRRTGQRRWPGRRGRRPRSRRGRPSGRTADGRPGPGHAPAERGHPLVRGHGQRDRRCRPGAEQRHRRDEHRWLHGIRPGTDARRSRPRHRRRPCGRRPCTTAQPDRHKLNSRLCYIDSRLLVWRDGELVVAIDSFRQTSLGYQVNLLSRLLEQALRRRIAGHGVVPGQFPALLALYERDGLTQAQLCRLVRIEQPTMANTLNRMERDGLIRREPDPMDGRRSLVRLSARARGLVPELEAAAAEVNTVAAGDLTDIETITLIELLTRVVAELDRRGP